MGIAFVWYEVGAADADAAFKKADTNSDGKIDAVEYKQSSHAYQSMGHAAMSLWKQGKAKEPDFGAAFLRLDSDKDGSISKVEYLAANKDWLTAADTNHDGAASKEEWLAFAKVNHVKDANEDTFNEETFM